MRDKPPRLVVEVQNGELWDLVLERELTAIAYVIGRGLTCDINFDFLPVSIRGKISKRHFCLLRRSATIKDKYGKFIDPGYDLIDGDGNIKSSNGTWLNGHRIEGKVSLKHGDSIGVGRGSVGVRLNYHDYSDRLTSDLEDTLIDPYDVN